MINADIRQFDLATLGDQLVVFGNLPYSFSTEIVSVLLEHSVRIKRAILLLQREFVERLAAKPGGRDYGTLSIGCRLHADIRSGPIVSGDSFHPPTAVDSMLVELKFLGSPRFALQDPLAFRRVVKSAFMKRRKKIINSMKSSGFYTTALLEEAFRTSGIDTNRRAETLDLEEFVRLYRLLCEERQG